MTAYPRYKLYKKLKQEMTSDMFESMLTQVTWGEGSAGYTVRNHGQVHCVGEKNSQSEPDLLSSLRVEFKDHWNQEGHQCHGEQGIKSMKQ